MLKVHVTAVALELKVVVYGLEKSDVLVEPNTHPFKFAVALASLVSVIKPLSILAPQSAPELVKFHTVELPIAADVSNTDPVLALKSSLKTITLAWAAMLPLRMSVNAGNTLEKRLKRQFGRLRVLPVPADLHRRQGRLTPIVLSLSHLRRPARTCRPRSAPPARRSAASPAPGRVARCR